jgi:hypothetical protein
MRRRRTEGRHWLSFSINLHLRNCADCESCYNRHFSIIPEHCRVPLDTEDGNEVKLCAKTIVQSREERLPLNTEYTMASLCRTQYVALYQSAVTLCLQMLLLFLCTLTVASWSLPNDDTTHLNRRTWLIATASAVCSGSTLAVAAETIVKDPQCNDAGCYGAWDGLLANCPSPSIVGRGAGCVSSQDDTPGVFDEPWDYSDLDPDTWSHQEERLRQAILRVSERQGDTVRFLVQEDRYLRVVWTDGTSGETSVGEFYWTPNDTTVQFRLASLSTTPMSNPWLSTSNQKRAEQLRQALSYTKVPVLRNRKRTLLFFESEWDTFGPGSGALGSPAELPAREWERPSQSLNPRLPFLPWTYEFWCSAWLGIIKLEYNHLRSACAAPFQIHIKSSQLHKRRCEHNVSLHDAHGMYFSAFHYKLFRFPCVRSSYAQDTHHALRILAYWIAYDSIPWTL